MKYRVKVTKSYISGESKELPAKEFSNKKEAKKYADGWENMPGRFTFYTAEIETVQKKR